MRVLAPLLALVTTLGCASINGPRGGRIFLPPSNPNAAEQFERIKSLEGEWQWAPELAPELEGHVVTYHVTANGSAVLETLFPGDEFEMITIYHLDGDQLILTHYGSAGNQPTMRAERGTPGGSIHFNYIGATNLHSVNEGHMHAMTFLEIAPDELLTSWTLFSDQKLAGDRVFKLVRVDAEPEADREQPSSYLDDLGAGPGPDPLEQLEDTVESPELPAVELPADAEPEVEVDAELAELEAEIEADIASEEEVPEAEPEPEPEPDPSASGGSNTTAT